MSKTQKTFPNYCPNKATLTAVTVPAKVLKGCKHKVRISVAHNGETRYIITDITIDSAKEFRNGSVVKRPDAAFLNTKLRGILQQYQVIIDELAYTDGLTCAELVYQLKNAGNYKHRTLHSIYEEYMENANIKATTRTSYTYMWRSISHHLSDKLLAENITHGTIASLDKFLRRERLSPTSIRNYLVFVRVLLNYAKRCGYVQFRVDPFAKYQLPPMQVRQSWLTVDEMRLLRDVQLPTKAQRKCRDLIMLSYYLGGINFTDLLDVNFLEHPDTIHYVRKKTEGRLKMNQFVEFATPDEAREIIDRYIDKDGYISMTACQQSSRAHHYFDAHIRSLRKATGLDNLIYYSARKSFSQHAFTLGVPTSVIDYILGHRVDKGGTSLYSYISVTPGMATKAVRKVLDNLK